MCDVGCILNWQAMPNTNEQKFIIKTDVKYNSVSNCSCRYLTFFCAFWDYSLHGLRIFFTVKKSFHWPFNSEPQNPFKFQVPATFHSNCRVVLRKFEGSIVKMCSTQSLYQLWSNKPFYFSRIQKKIRPFYLKIVSTCI